MHAETIEGLNHLIRNLEDQLSFYTDLQDIIVSEGQELIQAHLEKINSLNQAKQMTLFRLRKLEDQRLKLVNGLAVLLGASSSFISLSELSELVGEPYKSQLLSLQKQLLQIIEGLKKKNAENTMVTEAALRNLNGAINEIKDTLAGKSTYQRKGSINRGPEKSGHLVRREV